MRGLEWARVGWFLAALGRIADRIPHAHDVCNTLPRHCFTDYCGFQGMYLRNDSTDDGVVMFTCVTETSSPVLEPWMLAVIALAVAATSAALVW